MAPVTMAPTTAPPKAPTASPFVDYTQIVSGMSFYWPNSTLSFKNISNKTITINTAQLQNGTPNIPAPSGMTASGSQTYNLPVLGTLAPGESTSFKMPSQKVNNDGYYFDYNFIFLYLIASVGSYQVNTNMRFTNSDPYTINTYTSLSNVPTTDIIVQYHP
jgi:hypothetical protein